MPPSDPREGPFKRILSLIEHGSKTDRIKGLDEFIYLFSRKRGSTASALDDKSFHRTFEVLFVAAKAEKQTYFSGRKLAKSSVATNASRLGKCAEALRLAVEHGTSKLKRKTILAVVDHIIQILPGPEEGLVQPLAQDYLKALTALLSHGPNVEILAAFDAEGWLSCVDFSIEIIDQYWQSHEVEAHSARDSPAPGAGQTMSLTMSTLRSTASSTQRGGGRMQRGYLQDALQCLLSLFNAPNAPGLKRSKELAPVIVQVLQAQSFSLSLLQQLAFALMNAVLHITQTESVREASSLVLEAMPLISYWWHSRSGSKEDALLNGVRIEMLGVLHSMHLQLEFLLAQGTESSLLSDIENLSDLLWADYSRLEERTQLRLDDLTLSGSKRAGDVFRTGTFGLHPFAIEAERKWAIVHNIARLEAILWKQTCSPAPATAEDEQPRKKQRITSGSNRISRKLRFPDRLAQFVALQILPFLGQEIIPETHDIQALLQQLNGLMADKDAKISSWAMIACAGLASLPGATHESLTPLWMQAWQMSVRCISMTASCRASCHLLQAIVNNGLGAYQELADDINNIIATADVNGPAVAVDSSVSLMTSLLHIVNYQVPSASFSNCNHVVRWFFLRWDPVDSTFITSYASQAVPLEISNLLRAASGDQELVLSGRWHPFHGPVGEALTLVKEREEAVRYLLLLNDEKVSSHSHKAQEGTQASPIAKVVDASNAQATRKLIAELLSAKAAPVTEVCEAWTKREDGSSQITSEKLRSVVSCLLVQALVLPLLIEGNVRSSQQVEEGFSSLLRSVCNAISAASDSEGLCDQLLAVVRPYIPALTNSELQKVSNEWKFLSEVLAGVSTLVCQLRANASSGNGDDLMDLDDEFGSQESRASGRSAPVEIPRRESSLLRSSQAFCRDTAERLKLFSILVDDPEQAGLVPSAFVDEFISIPDEDLVFCRHLIREVFGSDLTVNPDDAYRAIERIGSLVGRAAYSSSEVALDLCLDLMDGFMSIWADGQDELCSPVGDLYHYFLKAGFANSILSPRSQIRLAGLLLHLTEVGQEFTESVSMPSPIVSLFDILQTGSVSVKFFIGQRLPTVFGRFVLQKHESVFVDVLQNLPTDAGDREGIALRLFVLGQLAQEWPTLLRRCVYHIFETPANVEASKPHAAYCLRKISSSLSLGDPRNLFDLFAPQLLYTWLDDGSAQDIPYEIFGFSTINELLLRAQDELVALMMMRGQDDSIQELAKALRTDATKLVEAGFSKTIAYCMAHDTSMPKNDHPEGERRIQKILGKDSYHEHINDHFADIVGIFFSVIDQEGQVENSWARLDQFSDAAETMAEIKKCCHSAAVLLPNQQPLFRAKYLTRELELLCKRTAYEVAELWNPALVVSVARGLFNNIHQALGPLHSCSVLRKVRILVCLAGPSALQSYPLEMLLHSIRPLITVSECADDALGLSQWLISKGSKALSDSPSFLAGYALSTLASLRVFLETSQSSTTLESEFKETMDKARAFHAWFAKFLGEYQSPLLDRDGKAEAFQTITLCAAHIRSSGNAEHNTHESTLLLEILQDEANEKPLLNEASRKLALELLCGNFKIPSSTDRDAVGSDLAATERSKAVWKSCQADSLDDDYLAWAGRVVGKGFAASGLIDQDLVRESELPQYGRVTSGSFVSEQGILRLLQALTEDIDRQAAGLAESALRYIVSEAAELQSNDILAACEAVLSDQLLNSSHWESYRSPPSDLRETAIVAEDSVFSVGALEDADWPQRFTVYLAQLFPRSIVLTAVAHILANVRGFAQKAFPFVVHLALLSEWEKQQPARRKISSSLESWFKSDSATSRQNLSLLLNTILFLRTQRLPGEYSVADRAYWFKIDLHAAAAAATRCGMYKTALLFLEMMPQETARSSRRSSAVRPQEPTEILTDIFENIDDPDTYYGLSHTSSLESVLSRLEYEKDGLKSLAFRGAQYDSHLRRQNAAAHQDSQSLVGVLNGIGLAGLSQSLLQLQQGSQKTKATTSSTFTTARRLEVWNLPVPSSTEDSSATLYKAYQGCHQAHELKSARSAIYSGLGQTMRSVARHAISPAQIRQKLGVLAALTELDSALEVEDVERMEALLKTFEDRSGWMKSGRYEDVSHILSCRGTALSLMAQNDRLRSSTSLKQSEARLLEVRSMIMSSGVFRYHQATQETLNIATSLSDLVEPSVELGLHLEAPAKIEAANALWDQGEMIPSIHLLQAVEGDANMRKQTLPVSRPDLLSNIGSRISVARLEKPESIQRNYLQPALKELKGKTEGREAGKVHHQFAMFCDEQLQNPDGLEDLARLQHLRQGKSDEVVQLKALITRAKDSQAKARYQKHYRQEKQWLDLDEQEVRRVEQARAEFVRLSLENYMLSLAASDEHNNDALRFTALWLERSGEEATNEAVRKHIDKVPTRKLAALMTQLTSRLLDQNQLFQRLLLELVYRICVDHPYHGMYPIWSGMKARTNSKDDAAVLRQKATDRVGKRLAQTESVATLWAAIDKTSKAYHALAVERDASRYKAGQKIAVHSSPAGNNLAGVLTKWHVPPPTMQIELAADRDYRHIPFVAKLDTAMSIAGGISAPKIVTAVGSNGARYKQLVKGGNDDLRQDAIMEQVFAAVSAVLRGHRSTRQRNLGIRTYKVLPLTSASGLIEFVSDTVPLHEYLMPAHERYHPKDLKASHCRREISKVQDSSLDDRVRTYRKVADQFQPVMRYFFMEYFVDPDDWFARRTAYTRTTAAVSMLGHVLGIGDRHGHNVLLDSKTGEVVHIDLGIAFEMGRVLPVPESVPFRLTRDIIDGMGITKTEGVFRRCCEFTLDALREETYSIMTILDVLRYDPLHSWSISPVRMAKLQDTRRIDGSDAAADVESDADARSRKKEVAAAPGAGVINQPSEADRALEVVRKKLSKTLSVTATVNDLINQATDEKNLAVLFSGWAAYA